MNRSRNPVDPVDPVEPAGPDTNESAAGTESAGHHGLAGSGGAGGGAVGASGSGGRELAATLALLVAGAALLLFASGQDWLGLPEQAPGGSGADVAPAARALGLVGLAGVVAVPATRGVSRRVAGGVLTLAGIGAAVATLLARPGAAALDVAPDAAVTPGAWWSISLVGAACLMAVGALTVWRCDRWPAMGARYEAPGGGRRDDAWAMLDRGEDPTVPTDPDGREE